MAAGEKFVCGLKWTTASETSLFHFQSPLPSFARGGLGLFIFILPLQIQKFHHSFDKRVHCFQ